MALTPEQRKAHEVLDEAIKEVLRLQGVKDEDPDEAEPFPMLVDWIVVAEGMRYEENGDSVGYHNIIFRGGQVRLSVALGLLDIGDSMLREGEDEQ